MGLNKWGVGCNCCGCVVQIKVMDWCLDLVIGVDIKVFAWIDDEPGDLLFEGNTGASGILTIPVPGGVEYLVEPTKEGYNGYNPVRTLECGVNEYNLTATLPFIFQVNGCPPELGNFATRLNDARIILTGTGSYELQVVDGVANWYPMASGDYHVLITHPSGYFIDYETDISVTACGSGYLEVDLEIDEDYTCCYGDYGKPSPSDGLPRGKILVTTSAGDSWEFGTPGIMTGCYTFRVSYSEPGQQIAEEPLELKHTDPPEPGGSGCAYYDYPPDLHTGVVGVKIKVEYPRYLNDGTWVWGFNASLAPPEQASHGRLDPMTYDECTGLITGETTQSWKAWYVGTEPYGGDDAAIGWVWEGYSVIHSQYPLSATIYFGTGDPECWEWSGGYSDTRDCVPPPPLSSITLTEQT